MHQYMFLIGSKPGETQVIKLTRYEYAENLKRPGQLKSYKAALKCSVSNGYDREIFRYDRETYQLRRSSSF